MDTTEQNLKVFFIAAALGAFVLALYEAKDEFLTPLEPATQEQQMQKQDKTLQPPVSEPEDLTPGF